MNKSEVINILFQVLYLKENYDILLIIAVPNVIPSIPPPPNTLIAKL